MTGQRRVRRLLVVIAAAVVSLAALSTVGLAAAAGAFRAGASSTTCTAPSLPGDTVDVRLMSMGDPMTAGPMMGGRMPGTSGTMRIVTNRQRVPAGTVSFRVANAGMSVHELVVLPLAPGDAVGQRSVGPDGRIDETGKLGEASNSCGEGEGDGISPGAIGWVTLDLPPGDYELLCNLSGHYAAGMHAALHVG